MLVLLAAVVLWQTHYHNGLRVDRFQIGDKEYEASYFGRQNLADRFPELVCREFWRLEDAYDDLKDCPALNNVLPCDNYPMPVAAGQVFVIDITKTDGTLLRQYYRADGDTWQGRPTTLQIEPDR